MKRNHMRTKIAIVTAAVMMCNQMFGAGVTIGAQSEESLQEVKAVQELTETEKIVGDEGRSAKTSEYIVQAENAKTLNQVMEEKQENIVEEEHTKELEEQQMVVLELTEEEVQALSESKDIAFVEENVSFTASAGKNNQTLKKQLKEKNKDKDCRKEQWYLDAVHLPEKAKGKDEIKIAVLDSGISFSTDIDVEEHISINEENQVDNVMFADATGHGTGLAGIIAAKDNGEGIRGIYSDAKIYSIQVLDENNQTTLSQVIAGIYQAMEWDCNILNMSFGTEVNSELLHQALQDAYDSGMLLIAAAGNQEESQVEFPAAYKEVVAVGSTDTSGNKTEGTSDGEEIEIFAPGSQIITTGLFEGTMVTDGTSMAAAQVSGAASLLWSLDRKKDANFIRSLLVNSAQNVKETGKSGAGLLDITNAIEQYEELEKIYQPELYEYEQLQSNSLIAEEFKGIKLVNGSWSKDAHAEMAKKSTKLYKVKTQYINLMQKSARWADEKYSDVHCIHATGNYVKSLKFLYQCAEYLRQNKSVEYSVTQASKEVGLNTDNTSEEGKLRVGVKNILNPNRIDPDSKKKESIYVGTCPESAEARYYVVMGLAIHLTGDTFAHRTIVPRYTIKGTNPKTKKNSTDETSFDARFGTENFIDQPSHKMETDATLKEWARRSYKYPKTICKRWNCFQQTVKLGVMEFKDIKNYDIKGKKVYEDKANFCIERFEDAKAACDCLFYCSSEKYTYDGVMIFRPMEENVKLNNLKGYVKKIGGNISGLTATEWKKVSTPEMY